MKDQKQEYREVWDADRREYVTVCAKCFPAIMDRHVRHPKEQPYGC